MLAIRKHFCWVYGLSAFVCLGFAVVLLLAIGSPQRLRLLPLHAIAAVTMLVAPPVTVGLIVDARHQKRTDGQLRLVPGAAVSIVPAASTQPTTEKAPQS